jgi:hypothetical protein
MAYLNKKRFFDVDELPDSYVVSKAKSALDDGAWVKITKKMAAFREEHPEATPLEVYNCELTDTTAQDFVQARREALTALYSADQATNVFRINGLDFWLDKDTRSAMYSLTIPALRNADVVRTKLWTNVAPQQAIEIEVERLARIIEDVEVYAKLTYDVTAQARVDIMAAEDVEALSAVVYEYPEVLCYEMEEE